MTVVIAPPAFWVDGELRLHGDNGQPYVVKFRARFNRMKKTERIEFMKRLAAREVTDSEVVKSRLCDWEILNMQGEKVPYTEANRDELIEDYDGLEQALAYAFFKAIGLVAPAGTAEKNSEAPSATTSEQTAQTATS